MGNIPEMFRMAAGEGHEASKMEQACTVNPPLQHNKMVEAQLIQSQPLSVSRASRW